MPQATRRWISEKVKSLHESDVLPFHELLDAEMVNSALAAEGVTFNERIYTPLVTLCLFLSQVLDPDHSCRAAVARLIVWLTINRRKPCSPETNSYCDARQRLPLGVIVRLVHQTAQRIEASASDEWLWKRRKVSLIDGTTSSMPDTLKNQQVFPQSNTRGIGLGFPVVRMVALISLATGVVRDLALGPYKGKETGETALFRTLLDGLEPGEIVVGDRCFASFFMLAELMRREVDGLFRMHQRRKFDFRRGRRLSSEDHVVTWTKPARPEWMDEETYAQIPNELKIRELRFKVKQPGFRVNELVLVTTMLDAEEYTKEDLADLFVRRWNIELDLRSIKDRDADGRAAVSVAGDGEEGDLDAFIGLQFDPRRDSKSGRGARSTAARVKLQGGAADDDSVPRRVAMGEAERTGPPDDGDAEGDRAPPCRRPLRPGRAACQQASPQTSEVLDGTAR